MSGYTNISEAERDELEEAFFTLNDLVQELENAFGKNFKIKGISLIRARNIIGRIKGGK